MQVFGRGVPLVSKGVVEPRDTKGRAARSLRMVRRSQSYRGIINFREPETVQMMRRWNSVETVQSSPGDARWSHQVNLCSFDSAKGVDFPSCEKVVKMIVKDVDTLGNHIVVFRCDNKSILAFLRAVWMVRAGDVVQATSAEGDPQFNGAAERSVTSSKCIKLAASRLLECGSDSRPRLVDVACAVCSQYAPSVCGWSRRQDSIRKKRVGRRAVPSRGTVW